MSDTIKKRVGLGTAYGFAKAGGYEGTVAEFTELLGNIAIDLARIENLSVTVTTLPAGSQATASLNGSVLSLGIPKGDKGDKGNTGNTPDFGIGTVTTLSAGSSATASITGTAEAPVLNLGIPEGQAGSGAVGTVADAYSSSSTYAVGDYAIHDEELYVCTTAITTAEAFTAAHWTKLVLTDEVSDLKSNFVSNGQLIDPATIGIFTGYINGSGVFKSSSGFRTLYLPCVANMVYAIYEKEYSTTNRIISLSANAPVEEATSTYIGSVNAINPVCTVKPENNGFICVTYYNQSVDASVESALANIKIKEGVEITEGFEYGKLLPMVTYGGLDSVMLEKDKQYTETANKLDAIYNVNSGENIIDIAEAISGYYVSLAGMQPNANYKYFDYIQVKANTAYTIYQSGGSASMLACVFYDENKIALSYYSPFTSATSPANAKYMRVSCGVSTTKISVVEGSVPLDIPYWVKLNGNISTNKTPPMVQMARSASMSANDSLDITIPDIKKNGVYGLHMNVTTMGAFTFGAGRTKANRSAFVTVDETNITVHYYNSSGTQVWKSYAHGLAITNELDLVIKQANDSFGEATIRLSSSGSSYKVPELVYWKGNDSPLSLAINSGTFTDISMTFYCTDYTKDLYIFGDSYLDHWPRYVMNTAQNNYQNYLLDGFGGRGSLDAVASLKIIEASYGIPKKILWCMGMNDGDNEAINTNWLKALTIIIDYCNQYNVELILCTIPNVATVDNTYKNAYIRTSGYRYVDLAKAVGSDVSTSWFSGLLSNDGVHPSTAGDKMIADFMISQVPEMI